MTLRPWKRVSGGEIHSNPWWSYRKDLVTLPSGAPGEYFYVHTNGSSMTVAFTIDGKVLLVNQHRYLASRESLEFPCGSVKDGATFEQTAVLELAEETSFAARSWFQVGEFNPYNGVTDEMCRVYVARDLYQTGGEPDETEEFEVVRLLPSDIDEKIGSGEIWDGMTIAAWAMVRPRMAALGLAVSSEAS